MNDLSIIASIGVGCLIGGIIFWQYKLVQSIKYERETNENLRKEIQAMADRIHLLRQEKCELKMKLAANNDVTQSEQPAPAPRRGECVTFPEKREELKKAEIIEERLGNGDWVQVLLILERNIEEHGRSTKHLSEFEKALIKSASFFFSDLDTDSDTNVEKYLDWNICALELMKEHFLTILYPGERHSKKDKESEEVVTQNSMPESVPGDLNCVTNEGVSSDDYN